ncbi:MAG: hypothetical protein K2O18_03770, partial [Oscillospiraceae bacterium]|nr:hypothetical protein [Oscillospiraceae bacterium]
YMSDNKPTTSYKEVKIGNTIYRVTSVFTGEKDLGKTLEQLAINRAMAELTACPTFALPRGWPHPCVSHALHSIMDIAGAIRREPSPHRV